MVKNSNIVYESTYGKNLIVTLHLSNWGKKYSVNEEREETEKEKT